MKKSFLLYFLVAGYTLSTLSSCDTPHSGVGSGLMPDYDKINSFSEEYPLEWRTVGADMTGEAETTTSANNIYVSSTYGYFGSIPNTEYGHIRTEFMTQVYCPEHFKFSYTPYEGKVDSAFIRIYYQGFTGDSIAPMEISAYRLSTPLPFTHLSVSDASKYISTELLGKTTYNASRGQGTIIRNQEYVHYVQIPISTALGQEFYDKTLKNDPVFSNQSNFDTYFPGIYLSNSAGTGSVLRVEKTSLAFFVTLKNTIKTKNGGDSIVYYPQIQELSHTPEVPQLSIFKNEGLEKLLQNNSAYAYIKSPAGTLAEITIPTTKISKYLKEAPQGSMRDIVSAPLVISGESQGNGTYELRLPDDLIVLPKDSVVSFFKTEMTEADSPFTTFISQRTSSGSTTYNFGNIASLIKRHIAKHPDKDLKVWIIPVDRTVSTNQYNSNSQTSTSISNLVHPTAMKFPKEDNSKLKLYFTERKLK